MKRKRPTHFLERTLIGWLVGALATPATALAVAAGYGMATSLGAAVSLVAWVWLTAALTLAPAALAHYRTHGAPAGLPMGLAATAGPSAAILGLALLNGTNAWAAITAALVAVAAAVALVARRVRNDHQHWRRVTVWSLAIHSAAYLVGWALNAAGAGASGGAEFVMQLFQGVASLILSIVTVGALCGGCAVFVLRLIAPPLKPPAKA